MPAGVEREHVDVGAAAGDGVQDRLILDAEAGREGDAPFDRAGQEVEALAEIAATRHLQVKQAGRLPRRPSKLSAGSKSPHANVLWSPAAVALSFIGWRRESPERLIAPPVHTRG